MLDGVSLDQLRTFIAAADEGSFSAAGRRLRRAQSVVSQTLANLEGQLGVKLFDRSARLPLLTDQGRALLVDARAVAGDIDVFKARAKGMARGLEDVYVARYRACIDKKCAALICQQRETSASIEELHAELSFQIRERLADNGLGTPQAAPGRREAAFVRGRDEGTQLIQ